jgi:Ca-activated chloride channel homolog
MAHQLQYQYDHVSPLLRELRAALEDHAVFRSLIVILFSFTSSLAQSVQSKAVNAQPYTFRVPVDEISLRFHASDQSGAPVTQLTIGGLQLSDNGKAQGNIMTLQALQDLPIRAGFLFDISASVLEEVGFERSIIETYASQLLRKGVDQAFVMQFDTETLLTQSWTDLDPAIAGGTAAVGPRPNRYAPLTAIFDSLYTTCRDQWMNQSQLTGNFILLFTDGEDNASHAYLREAVDMCQRSHVAVYIVDSSRSAHSSEGYKTMNDLTHQTGGRLFIHPRREEIWKDLQAMVAEQRNQYFLVYKPSGLKTDGSFHRIGLHCLVPGVRVTSRSGYYAFEHP